MRNGQSPVPVPVMARCHRFSSRGDFFPVRNRALLAHASQINPYDFWFACPVEVEQVAWPTEDYHLAVSLVATEIPEDDLFTGITPATDVASSGISNGHTADCRGVACRGT